MCCAGMQRYQGSLDCDSVGPQQLTIYAASSTLACQWHGLGTGSSREVSPMVQVSKEIQIPDTEAVRVRREGERVELVLIDKDGAEQLVPVQMEAEKPRAAA